MPGCAALDCSNHSSNGYYFHSFPVNRERREIWARNTGRVFRQYPNNLPPITMKLCEVHFNEDQYIDGNRGSRKLKPTAVPTIFARNGEMIDMALIPPDNEREDDVNADNDAEIMELDDENPVPQHDLDCFQEAQALCHDPEHDVLVHLLREAEARNAHLLEENQLLMRERDRLNLKVQQSESKLEIIRRNLKQCMADDQIHRLETIGRDCSLWSEQTIKMALQMRLMAKVKGYEYIRTKCHWPLPSYRTICERLEKCSFPPGINNDIISFLGMKVREEEEISRNCYLSLDEMAITKKIEYDKGLKRFIGYISPEIARDEGEKGQPAEKALAFVVKGLSLHWKQTVAYVFTGASIDKNKLWECTKNVILKLHAEGLYVRGVATDMGPSNTGVWNLLQIDADEESAVTFCPHPANEDLRLYWSPDIPHLYKNFWGAITGQDLYLPQEIFDDHEEWNGHNIVSVSHLKKLVDLQEAPSERGLTLAHKLKPKHVDPDNLQKMRVGDAALVFSHTTAKALEFCAKNDDIPEIGHDALPTAWLLEQTNNWFDLMNSRKFGISEGYNGDNKIAKLCDFIDLIRNIKFQKPGWKPVQRGIVIATTTAIHLHEDLVKNGAFRYLLTGRLTTDSTENLFSQVRSCGDSHPGAAQVRLALRLITTGQLLHVPEGSNYDIEDEARYMVDFLKRSNKTPVVVEPVADEDQIGPDRLSVTQENGLYYVAGWTVFEISKGCLFCQEILIGEGPLEDCPFNQWTTEVSRGGLKHPSKAAYDAIRTADSVFNILKESVIHRDNVVEVLVHHALENVDDDVRETLVSECNHNPLHSLLQRYMNFRVHTFAADLTRKLEKEVVYSGRTVYMRTSADTYGRHKRRKQAVDNI